MIKTLRITSVVAVIFAAVVLASVLGFRRPTAFLHLNLGTGGDKQIDKILSGPSAVDRFKEKFGSKGTDGEDTTPGERRLTPAGEAGSAPGDSPGGSAAGGDSTWRGWHYRSHGDYHRNLDPSWSYAPTYLAKMRHVRRFLAGLPREAHILDAGCGEGVLVEELAGQGFAIEGGFLAGGYAPIPFNPEVEIGER